VTLVNTSQLESRTVVVQAGGYGEHRFTGVAVGSNSQPTALNGPHAAIRLAPGSGARLVFSMQRFVNTPTMAFPWNN
jgi:hypothetical protein